MENHHGRIRRGPSEAENLGVRGERPGRERIGKFMRDVLRLSVCSLGVIGGAFLMTGVAGAQPSMAQESVAVRAELLEGGPPGGEPNAPPRNNPPRSECPI